MRTALLVALSATTWVYLIEWLKGDPRCRWIHFRTDERLRLLALAGAVVSALLFARHEFLLATWGALVTEHLVYDAVVHRRRAGSYGAIR